MSQLHPIVSTIATVFAEQMSVSGYLHRSLKYSHQCVCALEKNNIFKVIKLYNKDIINNTFTNMLIITACKDNQMLQENSLEHNKECVCPCVCIYGKAFPLKICITSFLSFLSDAKSPCCLHWLYLGIIASRGTSISYAERLHCDFTPWVNNQNNILYDCTLIKNVPCY